MRMPSPSGWSGSQTPGATLGVGVRTLHRLVGYHSRIISVALSRYEKTRTTEHLLLDPVTGLPDRVAFIEELKRWTSRGGLELAVIALDLQDVVGSVSDRGMISGTASWCVR
jgi:hypothetical protein